MDVSEFKFNFSNTTTIVVGGSRGIGYQVACNFSKCDSNVIIISRTKPEELQKNMTWWKCDVSDWQNIQKISFKIQKLNKIDHLVYSAAVNKCVSIQEINEKEWDRVNNINLKSFFLFCKIATKKMKEQKFGTIVGISSIAGRNKSLVSGVHYTATKAAMIGFTRQLSQEVGKFNIRVNLVCPSQTKTKMLLESMTEQQIKALEKNIPLKRIATTEEIANPIMFLCSSASSYITGAIIDINGGQL